MPLRKVNEIVLPEGMFNAFASARHPGARITRHRYKLASALVWMLDHYDDPDVQRLLFMRGPACKHCGQTRWEHVVFEICRSGGMRWEPVVDP
jgi:hypothetical protein